MVAESFRSLACNGLVRESAAPGAAHAVKWGTDEWLFLLVQGKQGNGRETAERNVEKTVICHGEDSAWGMW